MYIKSKRKNKMLKPTTCYTTGITADGESKLLDETVAEAQVPYPIFGCFQIQELFYTEENPQSLATRHHNKPYDIELPEGAMRFMKLRMPTKTEISASLQQAGEPLPDNWESYNLHSTDSVDYIYVLSGAISCITGTQRLELKTGDFLTQVGPEHTWINDNNEPCYLLAAMVGIKPSGTRKKMTVE